MQQLLQRARLVVALVIACVMSPALTGFAAACGTPAMPCCQHASAAPATMKAGCCRVEPTPAPAHPPLVASRIASSVDLAPYVVPTIVTVPAGTRATAAIARAPSPPHVPLYIALSTLRR